MSAGVASTLQVLLPSAARCANEPVLVRWRQRADSLDTAAPGRLAAVAGFFRTPGARLAVAALTRERLAGDATGAGWLCADPASMQTDINGARMIACGTLDLVAAEAEALAQDLRPLFGDRGCLLETTTPSRWHLRLPPGAVAPALDGPEQALGDDLLQHLPQGADARRWRLLFNEAQMILHAHPVNQARRQRGQLPVNAVWLWGGGSLPATVKTPFAQVFSDDALVQALAARARVALVQPGADFGAGSTAGNVDTLLDLGLAEDIGAALARLQADWRRRRSGVLLLAFASGERYRLRRWHRWRVWRRA